MNIVIGKNGKKTVKNIMEEMTAKVNGVAQYTLRSGTKPWRVNFGEGYTKMRCGFKPELNGVVINWAHQAQTNPNAIVYNAGNGIFNSSNKTRARIMLKNAGVNIPDTVQAENVTQIQKWLDDGFTLISRPNKHLAGKNFVVIKPTDSLEGCLFNGGYVSKFFEKTAEYRVHASVFGVFRVQKKTPREEVDLDTTIPQPWNHATGDFKFVQIDIEDYDPKLCKLALDGLHTLGLDFGAVDILGTDDELVITEINTSPGAKKTTLTDYAKFFDWLGDAPVRKPELRYDEATKRYHYLG
jgi:hypothetical protein